MHTLGANDMVELIRSTWKGIISHHPLGIYRAFRHLQGSCCGTMAVCFHVDLRQTTVGRTALQLLLMLSTH